ncbi:unnamed protein product [Gongylonema pulchrum]|uniref:HOOK domain-containing protein n=1 Tax=Gongylonema pulchrum TaxID=637853 RepID=A0A183ERU3_9BILA|nr:unnamed protein product [Gongylonema pulchrum]
MVEAKNESDRLHNQIENLLRVESIAEQQCRARRNYDRVKAAHDDWELNINAARMERNNLKKNLEMADQELAVFEVLPVSSFFFFKFLFV